MFIDAERYKLRSKEANNNHPNAESDSNHCAYWQSSQCHMAVRSEASKERGGAYV